MAPLDIRTLDIRYWKANIEILWCEGHEIAGTQEAVPFKVPYLTADAVARQEHFPQIRVMPTPVRSGAALSSILPLATSLLIP